MTTKLFDDIGFGDSLSRAILGEKDDHELAQDDFSLFAQKVLVDERTGDPIKLQSFQKEVINALESDAEIILIILPRGFGKSMLVTIGFVSWLIGRDPNLRIIVASNTEGQAVSHLTGIETVLASREYQQIFGNLIPTDKKTVWSQTVKYVKRSRSMRHPTLLAAGSGSATVTGKRSDLILIDDLIDQAAASSEAERESSWQWFSTALQDTLDPTGLNKTIIVNTRYHIDDIAGRLKENYGNDAKFRVIDIPALEYVDAGKGEVEERSIWEERFSTEWLIRRRERAYFAFMSNFMNDPLDVTKAQLDESWLQYVDKDSVPPFSEMEFFAGVDPNTSKETMKKDYFAMVIVGVHPKTRRIYIVDMLYTKANLKSLKEQFKAKVLQWNPTKIVIETNASQILYETIFNDDREFLDYPFQSHVNTLKKEERILQMVNHFIAGRISTLAEKDEHGKYHPIMSLQPIRREWLTFPHSRDSHFDALDALDMAIRPLLQYAQEVAFSVLDYDDFSNRVRAEQKRKEIQERIDNASSKIKENIEEAEANAPISEPDMAELRSAYAQQLEPKLTFGFINTRF